jgi:hypothetical protein
MSVNTKNNNLAKRVALFTNARDELHIKEWAAHHLLIGFDFIVIFDHKSKIPLQKVFENFDKRVKTFNVSKLNGALKMDLMNYAKILALKHRIDWILYLDADEFLILNKKFIGVKHFLYYYRFADSIGINWLLFGSNNLKEEPKGLILESYTKSRQNIDQHVKSFVRVNKILSATNPHFYNIKDKNKMYGINGNIIKGVQAFNKLNNVPYYNVNAYIAHYVNQSEETFRRRKGLLPRDDTGEKRIITEHDIKNLHAAFNDVDNLDPKNRYSENIKKFLEQYK